MWLTDLDPQFYGRPIGNVWPRVPYIADAVGVQFLCPLCYVENGGPVGTHAVMCWSPDVPLTVKPGPGRWEIHGTGFVDLTLRNPARSDSIALTDEGGCKAHFFVRDGRIL